MRWKSCSKPIAVFVMFGMASALAPCALAASKEKVLYSFKGGSDGATPAGALVADNAGNLYGVTLYGGAYGNGTVFELKRSGADWRESVLHTFGKGNDGDGPYGLTLDSAGNIYGTTAAGGGAQKTCSEGCGTVFELTRDSRGNWRESIIHRFKPGRGDGAIPYAGVVLDATGNLYGATAYGGTGGCNGGCGAVFELEPSKGRWAERVIYSFNDTDGKYASNGLILDAKGNLYGGTAFGGIYSYGVIFELTRSSRGKWSEKVLYNFNYYDGAYPAGALIFDGAGHLYGATDAGGGYSCGCCGCGTVFALTVGSNGQWSETILHHFTGRKDGRYPTGPLLMGKAGNLYGGGSGDNKHAGDVFELVHAADAWKARVLYTFTGGADGRFPGPVIFKDGDLVGTAAAGGDDQNCGDGCGVVFGVTP
jgi:uncharacterized repeat protein (TIGR03803 family)